MSVARPVRKLYLIWNKTHSPACCACQRRRGGHRRGRILLSRPLCFSCLLDSLGRRYPRIVGGSQPCRTALPPPFFPRFPAGENPREEKGGPLCPPTELRARKRPFSCTCRPAEISLKELWNLAVISKQREQGYKFCERESIIIGKRKRILSTNWWNWRKLKVDWNWNICRVPENYSIYVSCYV